MAVTPKGDIENIPVNTSSFASGNHLGDSHEQIASASNADNKHTSEQTPAPQDGASLEKCSKCHQHFHAPEDCWQCDNCERWGSHETKECTWMIKSGKRAVKSAKLLTPSFPPPCPLPVYPDSIAYLDTRAFWKCGKCGGLGHGIGDCY